jgi:hypothetical protein
MNFISFNEVISNTKNDKQFSLKYLTDLYNYVNDNLTKPIKCNIPLTAIKCFIPLPTRFLLDEQYKGHHQTNKSGNEYSFLGKPGNRILFADKILPFMTNNTSFFSKELIKYPMPFSFPIYNENDVEIILSNVYYFEIKVKEKVNTTNNNWHQECISIGFGNKNVPFNSHAGWYGGSIGFHSDDGSIRFNSQGETNKIYSRPWIEGDIIGAGVIYTDINTIIPFFTFNGELIYKHDVEIIMTTKHFPIIGYDHSHKIKVNFSNDQFLFDIKNLIYKYSNKVILSDNSFIQKHNIEYYLNDTPHFIKSGNKFLGLSSSIPIIPPIPINFSFTNNTWLSSTLNNGWTVLSTLNTWSTVPSSVHTGWTVQSTLNNWSPVPSSVHTGWTVPSTFNTWSSVPSTLNNGLINNSPISNEITIDNQYPDEPDDVDDVDEFDNFDMTNINDSINDLFITGVSVLMNNPLFFSSNEPMIVTYNSESDLVMTNIEAIVQDFTMELNQADSE